MFSASLPHQQPICPYYTRCGGCSLQHLSEQDYKTYKEEKVKKNLGSLVVGTEIEDLILLPHNSRRRCVLKAQKSQGKVQIGYNARSSHQLVDIEVCPLLTSSLQTVFPLLKKLLDFVLPQKSKAEIYLLAAQNGLDVVIKLPTIPQLSFDNRETIVKQAMEADVIRLRLQDNRSEELLLQASLPIVSFSNVTVPVDATQFLQASYEADIILQQLVMEGVTSSQPRRKIVDLFCGRGTLTFTLANIAKVDAFEMDRLALSVLDSASKKAQKSISCFYRNLFSTPLSAQELRNYDCVILDPPRDGALSQSHNLAESSVPCIVYVSCNPQTFVRDAKILLSGGYTLKKCTPLDQFTWSEHIELVGVFKKEK